MTIGEQIKKYRKSNKLTQKQLAEKTNIGIASIQRYERNELKPNIEILKKIATAFNISINELIEDKKYNPLSTNKAKFTISDMLLSAFINGLYIEKPYDKKISDLKDKMKRNEALSDEDMQIINDNKQRKSLENDFGIDTDISVMEYEKESYDLFKKLLISFGYDSSVSTPYLFKKIKAQIELEIYMNKFKNNVEGE